MHRCQHLYIPVNAATIPIAGGHFGRISEFQSNRVQCKSEGGVAGGEKKTGEKPSETLQSNFKA